MYQRILVALGDDDAINDQVVTEAAAIAQPTQGNLNLLHVIFPPSAGFPDPIYLTTDGMHSTVTTESFQMHMNEWQTLQHQNQVELDTKARQMADQGITAEWTQAVGDPGRQICRIAKDWHADLIVLGRRGRAGLSELFLGSVSNYVMHHAPCSVMAVQGAEVAASV